MTEMKPAEVSDLDLAFPAHIEHLMPESIPKDYSHENEWVKFQQTWFYRGLDAKTEMLLAEGVDAPKAWRHLSAIQGSFAPKHEHKEAAVAYLASQWFTWMRYKAPDDSTWHEIGIREGEDG